MNKVFPDMGAIKILAKRHGESEGFCRCCGEPWPCDVRLIDGILFEDSK